MTNQSKLKQIFKYTALACFIFFAFPTFNLKRSEVIDSGKDQRPNFLLIAVDDLNTFNSVLGIQPGIFLEKVYPDSVQRLELVKRLTPNLDKFAEKALTFNHAYCASPLCGPSRTALLTGIPTHVSGYYQHDQHFRGYETLTDAVTLPQYLKQNGYYTSGIGKIFHKGMSYLDRGYFSDWPDQIYSWSHWVEAYSGTGTTKKDKDNYTENISKYWKQGNKSSKDYTRFGKTTLPVEYSNDWVNARHIAQLMLIGQSEFIDTHGQVQTVSLPEGKPWFLACGIFAPHLPWIARQEFYDLFPKEEMQINHELREWVLEDLKDLSQTGVQRTTNTGFDRLLKYGLELEGEPGDMEAWKEYVQSYLATIAYADRCLGVLFQAIEENHEKENTVVVLFSDHGYHVGDKNRQGKTTLWEASNHCNMMIYNPSIVGANSGRTAAAGVSLQDIYPTIVNLAGLKRPEQIYGFDLTPILENPNLEWEHPVLSTYEKDNHTIRTKEFRYIRFSNGDQELYKIDDDSFETKNLANLQEWKDELNELNTLLDQRLQMEPVNFQTY